MDLIPLSDDELLYRSFYEELGEDGMKPRMPGDAGLKSALAKAIRRFPSRAIRVSCRHTSTALAGLPSSMPQQAKHPSPSRESPS